MMPLSWNPCVIYCAGRRRVSLCFSVDYQSSVLFVAFVNFLSSTILKGTALDQTMQYLLRGTLVLSASRFVFEGGPSKPLLTTVTLTRAAARKRCGLGLRV